MKRKSVIIIGILFAVVGLTFLCICVFQNGKNTVFLSIGTICNGIAVIIYCLTIRPNKTK